MLAQIDEEDPPHTVAARAMNARRWSQVTDRAAATAPGRAAFWQRFLDEVDPNRELPDHERTRRALAARQHYYADLGRRSGEATRVRKAVGGAR